MKSEEEKWIDEAMKSLEGLGKVQPADQFSGKMLEMIEAGSWQDQGAEDWADSALDSLQGLGQVESDPKFNEQMLHKIEAGAWKNSAAPRRKFAPWLAAAAVALLIINALTLISLNGGNRGDFRNKPATIDDFRSEYNLQPNSYIDFTQEAQ